MTWDSTPTGHQPTATTRQGRWQARCRCGWWTPCTGRSDAEQRMLEHSLAARVRANVTHTCYFGDGDTVEFDDRNCPACIADQLLTGRAA